MKAPVYSLMFGLSLACLAPATQANLLTNGGFDIPGTGLTAPNFATSMSGINAPTNAAANGWFSYNNVTTTTSTELLTSTDPAGSGYMIHVTTGGQQSGIRSLFPTVASAALSVDVFVISGQAWRGKPRRTNRV
ncbi:MAG: hypothetical protein PHU46_01255 [Rhodocyclaceae bacterium]|nr:hypothetical protein [Rhodocyclaceae bacterium]